MLKMNNMVMLVLAILPLCVLGLAEVGQEEESVQLHNIYTTTRQEFPKKISSSGLAIWVSENELNQVSRSVLMAETWLRANVLSHYPYTPITTILVGTKTTLLPCQKRHQNHPNDISLLLPSLRNLHHSLTRWGLSGEIKLSATLSPCEFDRELTKPISEYLQAKNSSMTVVVSSSQPVSAVKGVDFFDLDAINLVVIKPDHVVTRELSSFPTRPIPLPETSDPPLHSSVGLGLSVPSNLAKPPQLSASPPPLFTDPVTPPPFGFAALPPCNPSLPPTYAHHPRGHGGDSPVGAPIPAVAAAGRRLWCVAKPSVPAETLQAAMDYACGEGGADCGEIAPRGKCYEPVTVVAHASYAFNSYWQKQKRVGGTCSFGGTAMLINSDPSFLNCRFIIA